MLHLRPHELRRIKLGGVSRKEVGMNPRIAFKESLDRPGLMHSALVPQKNEPSPQVPQEISQKRQDLRMSDVLQRVKADIQIDSPLAGGNADRGDRRYLRPSSGDLKDRGLSPNRPSFPDTRHKAKPALVEEDQRKFKPFGLFLYGATYGASNVLFPFHPALGLLSRVFDNSFPSHAKATRRYWGGRRLGTSFQSPGRFSGLSKDRSSTRSSWHLQPAPLQGSFSGARLASRAVQESILASNPHLLLSHADVSNSKPSFWNNQSVSPYPTDLSLYPAALRLVVSALQAVLGSHGVAWDQFTTKWRNVLLFMRKSITNYVPFAHFGLSPLLPIRTQSGFV
jgi:hypothetical protein